MILRSRIALSLLPSPVPSASPAAAPPVDTTGLALLDGAVISDDRRRFHAGASTRVLRHNLPLEDIAAPILGPVPEPPSGGPTLDPLLKNHRTGVIDRAHIHQESFRSQMIAFDRDAVSAAPQG